MKFFAFFLALGFILGGAIHSAASTDAPGGLSNETGVPPSPKEWEIRCADGSNNRWIVSVNASAPHGFMQYLPVKPSESSSGFYSGGEPREGELKPAAAAEIHALVSRLASDSSGHVANRMMGTGLITIAEAGAKKTFILASGPELEQLLELLRRSRPANASGTGDAGK